MNKDDSSTHSGATVPGGASDWLPSIEVELEGARRRRVFFDEAMEARRVWLLPHGGKQTEREVRSGTKDWHDSVTAARVAIAKKGQGQ